MYLICGEALFDIFVTEQRADGLTLDARPGGSPFNVAVGMARLGWPVELFTGLSDDALGSYLQEFLAREGVGTTFAPRKALQSGIALVGLDARGGPTYSFNGPATPDRTLTEADLPEIGDDIAAIHLGSFSTVVPTVGGALEALAAREAGRRFISYDPNVRPTVEPDMAVWRRTLDRMVGRATLLKISREDLTMLDATITPESAARRWLGQGVSLVVVTDGANGASAWTKAGRVDTPCRPVQVIDTVGAGDTFQAALLAGLGEMGLLSAGHLAAMPLDVLRKLLEFAIEAAAITCARRGADMPRRSNLSALA